jgi:hypothetical protein
MASDLRYVGFLWIRVQSWWLMSFDVSCIHRCWRKHNVSYLLLCYCTRILPAGPAVLSQNMDFELTTFKMKMEENAQENLIWGTLMGTYYIYGIPPKSSPRIHTPGGGNIKYRSVWWGNAQYHHGSWKDQMRTLKMFANGAKATSVNIAFKMTILLRQTVERNKRLESFFFH